MTDWQEPGTDDGRKHSTPAGALGGVLVVAASTAIMIWFAWLAWGFLTAGEPEGLMWLALVLIAAPFWLALYREDVRARDKELYGRMSESWIKRNR